MTHGRRHISIALLGLVVLFLALRLLFLRADPPLAFPGGAQDYALFADPAAKAFEARNMALFGSWKAAAADDYQFWRPQSPVWVYPLALFFRVFGVGYAELRLFSILCSLLALFAFLALARRKLRTPGVLVAGLFFAINYFSIVYGRSGIIEPWLNAWLTIVILCLDAGRRSPFWLYASHYAFVLAFLTKQTALLLFPLLAAATVAACTRDFRSRTARRLVAFVPLLHLGLLCGALSLYVLSDDYWDKVVWNYTHMLGSGTEESHLATGVDPSRLPIGRVLRRMVDPVRIWNGYFALLDDRGTMGESHRARYTLSKLLHQGRIQ